MRRAPIGSSAAVCCPHISPHNCFSFPADLQPHSLQPPSPQGLLVNVSLYNLNKYNPTSHKSLYLCVEQTCFTRFLDWKWLWWDVMDILQVLCCLFFSDWQSWLWNETSWETTDLLNAADTILSAKWPCNFSRTGSRNENLFKMALDRQARKKVEGQSSLAPPIKGVNHQFGLP